MEFLKIDNRWQVSLNSLRPEVISFPSREPVSDGINNSLRSTASLGQCEPEGDNSLADEESDRPNCRRFRLIRIDNHPSQPRRGLQEIIAAHIFNRYISSFRYPRLFKTWYPSPWVQTLLCWKSIVMLWAENRAMWQQRFKNSQSLAFCLFLISCSFKSSNYEDQIDISLQVDSPSISKWEREDVLASLQDGQIFPL